MPKGHNQGYDRLTKGEYNPNVYIKCTKQLIDKNKKNKQSYSTYED